MKEVEDKLSAPLNFHPKFVTACKGIFGTKSNLVLDRLHM
jgi:hypothetical protein